MDILRQYYEQNKKWLSFSLLSTFLWGMAAHAYRFLNNTVSHDSLNEFHGAIFGSNHKIGLGRIFVPLYQDLVRGDILLPWLIGCFTLLWIGLAVFFVVRIFKIESRALTFLTAGIFTTNITISATAATYLGDLDSNALALLLAVAAAYAWNSSTNWKGLCLGAVLTAGSIGMYQSFIFVAVELVILVSILSLMEQETFQNVFRKGLLAVAMIVSGALLYALILKLMPLVTGLQLNSGEYNNLDKLNTLQLSAIPGLILGAYQDWFYRLIHMYSAYPSFLVSAMVGALFLGCGGALALAVFSKKMALMEKLLCVLLVLLLPLGSNLIYVLSLGENHDVMVYAIWLFFLFALLLSRWLMKLWKNSKWSKWGQYQHILCMLLILVLLNGNVQFANGMYLKKDIEYDAYLSLMTRVIDRVEAHEDYVPKETPVVFVGLPRILNEVAPGFKEYWNVTGMMKTDVIYTPQRTYYRAYIDYVMGLSMVLAEDDVWFQILSSDEAAQMPCYPSEECVQFMDGVLVVKLGNYY